MIYFSVKILKIVINSQAHLTTSQCQFVFYSQEKKYVTLLEW